MAPHSTPTNKAAELELRQPEHVHVKWGGGGAQREWLGVQPKLRAPVSLAQPTHSCLRAFAHTVANCHAILLLADAFSFLEDSPP